MFGSKLSVAFLPFIVNVSVVVYEIFYLFLFKKVFKNYITCFEKQIGRDTG